MGAARAWGPGPRASLLRALLRRYTPGLGPEGNLGSTQREPLTTRQASRAGPCLCWGSGCPQGQTYDIPGVGVEASSYRRGVWSPNLWLHL